MSQLGIFCTVARTELKEKVPDVSDDTLRYLNYAIKQAFELGKAYKTKVKLPNPTDPADLYCEVFCADDVYDALYLAGVDYE